ncbi:MAG: glycosyltransferase family 4 protein [Patescibacteria group bacterium]|nr:glycosyltransferase family 4 protein [Patescibacteria group bacterium]
MRVLLFPHCFFPAVDGGVVTFSNLALGLTKSGFEVEIITTNRRSSDDFFNPRAKKLPTEKIWQGMKITRLEVLSRGRRFFKLFSKITGADFFTAFSKGPVFLNLREIFRKREIDWVITGLFPSLTPFWAYLLAKRNGAKLAIIPGLHSQEKAYQNKFLLRLVGKSDLVLAFTDYERDLYRKMGIPGRKILVSAGLIDDFIFEFQKDKSGKFPKKPTILFLGVKAAHKRVPMLIEAMKLVWQKTEVDLVIAGPETLSSNEIKETLASLGSQNRKRIVYLGKVGQKRKACLIDQATVLVNPSRHESFGIVFIEAWARKKPVIAADLPALKQVIRNGEDGFLFKKDSVADLADKILHLVSNPGLAKIMGERGYQKANSRFRSQPAIKKIVDRLGKK